MPGWTDWTPLTMYALEGLPRGPGPYEVRWIGLKDRAKPVGRLADVDHEGLLYLGKSKGLRGRVANLLRRGQHKAADDHRRVHVRLRNGRTLGSGGWAAAIRVRLMMCRRSPLRGEKASGNGERGRAGVVGRMRANAGWASASFAGRVRGGLQGGFRAAGQRLARDTRSRGLAAELLRAHGSRRGRPRGHLWVHPDQPGQVGTRPQQSVKLQDGQAT